MRQSRNTVKKLVAASNFELQNLESRVLMTAVPLTVTVATGLLSVTGTTGNDAITVSRSGNVWTIANGSEWSITKTTATIVKIAVNGKAGDDTITIDPSVTVPATLLGDLGNDTITSAGGSSSISGGVGNDSLTANSSADTIIGNAGDDTLIGGAGADKLIGGDGNDSITANGGNDVIQGGLGSDTMSFGAGTDTFDYSDHTALQGIVIDLGAGTGGMTGETDTFTSDFEKFSGSNGADSITGTDNADTINGQGGNDTINGLGGNDVIWDGAGNDSVYGGDGDDSLYSVGGADRLFGEEGVDQLIAIGGGTADSVTGGNGADTFWTDTGATEYVLDADADELAAGAVHRVASFKNGVGKELNGARIADPKLTSTTSFKYRTFADRPLFATDGPSINDIAQGQVGDCYFLATIASIAKINPGRIEQSIVNLGDGTYGVRFVRNNVATYVRVDNDLPTYSWSTTQLAYTSFGAEGSMWAPLIEKAYAFFRKSLNTYASISSGFMTEVYSAFGVSSATTSGNAYGDANGYAAQIKTLLEAGKSVTAAVYTNPSGANLVTSHAYTVDSVIDNGDGTYSVVVRNPWGVDAGSSNDGANDGYVTLTAAQAFIGLGYICSATV